MKSLSFGLAALAVAALPALSFIHPKAVGASDKLATSAADLHHFMHHKYGPGYGSHDVEEASEDARDMLLLWDLGVASECEVVGAVDGVDFAFADMTSQFKANGLMNDPETKNAYKQVRKDYVKVHAWTAAGKCVGASASKAGHVSAGTATL